MAVVTRYVNTASSGGDGTTNATSGTNAAYASLAAWNAAEATDLVTAGDSHVVICTGGADTIGAPIALSGWTTDGTNTLTIRCDEALGPTFDTSKYHIILTDNQYVFTPVPAVLRVVGIRARTTDSAGGVFGLVAPTISADVEVDNCFIDGTFMGTVYGSVRAFSGGSASGQTLKVRNSIVLGKRQDAANGESYAFSSNYRAGTYEFYNCVFTNLNLGINQNAGTVIAKNCAVFNNANDFNGTITIDHCASDDGDGTNAIDISPGATESEGWNAAFTDYANGDFRVKDASSPLYHAGVAIAGLTTDIVGETYNDPPSVGAFELSSLPEITSVNGGSAIARNATGVVIVGTNLAGITGVTINSVAQTNVSASATEVTFDVVQGGMVYGTNYTLEITDGSNTDTATVQLAVPSGYESFTVAGLPWDAGEVSIFDGADPAVADGDIAEVESTTSLGSAITWSADGTYIIAASSGTHQFDARVWDATTSTWGAFETFTVSAGEGDTSLHAITQSITRSIARAVAHGLT